MTISEARGRRTEAALQINKILEELERETNLTIKELSIERVNRVETVNGLICTTGQFLATRIIMEI